MCEALLRAGAGNVGETRDQPPLLPLGTHPKLLPQNTCSCTVSARRQATTEADFFVSVSEKQAIY